MASVKEMLKPWSTAIVAGLAGAALAAGAVALCDGSIKQIVGAALIGIALGPTVFEVRPFK